jgi:hypothetical protein
MIPGIAHSKLDTDVREPAEQNRLIFLTRRSERLVS